MGGGGKVSTTCRRCARGGEGGVEGEVSLLRGSAAAAAVRPGRRWLSAAVDAAQHSMAGGGGGCRQNNGGKCAPA
jgi:hypothetical protein